MNHNHIFLLFVVLSVLGCAGRSNNQASEDNQIHAAQSEWVYPGKDGKLMYKKTNKGDRIMDFSYAGYMGGGVALPVVPVKITLSPSGADDTENIQSAIDQISAMPLDEKFRGAVALEPGVFTISSPIHISASGVVLKGGGSGLNGNVKTTINLKGKPFNAITIRTARENNRDGVTSTVATSIADDYVPSGSLVFNVVDAGGFSIGDVIAIRKPVTASWIEYMQMHDLVRDGKPQTWIREGSYLTAERRIAGISGNAITLDVPLSDSYDSHYLGKQAVSVEKSEQPNRISQSGVENLHIVSPLQPIAHSQPHFTALRIHGEDCWARDLMIEETMNSVAVGGRRITVQEVTINRKALHQGSSRPAEFAPNGTQVLIDRCTVIADNVWFAATGAGISGPIVMLNCTFIGDRRAESHQRWSTGMLYDNVRAENGGIDFRNRGSMGSGHGWSMGWGVAWNCVAKDYVIQDPPGAHNWMIGCIGESQPMPRPFGDGPNLPEGIKDSPGKPVMPQSLYLAQLAERLGQQAVENIGY